ncbi:hypothetical protein B9J90_06745 [Vibrio sp. V09_P4A23P171]|uniref:DUF2897 family protein n=1 Tax=Vibrio anguillarum TaxID=55601 RepID=A0A191W5F2_VIBAN|nr:hypothetical protein PN51_04530 [Vibrio anguillarum]MDF9388502.1 DUF2897 family protein [Vibrio sp. 1151_11]NAW89093.1 DUF2897 family protein [Vibrio sp. V24_P1S3T111]NAW96859.1 DUF2897 family protein [Vibrio sp. V23_P3S9T160]NAX17849.1 DUF2897 family protein [Vibrio sp. V22_P2S10T140]NAX43910.1 DUF2897 family protein [Vibrio sp. V25_P4S6T154]NNN94734.1 DUF2897 family protein [Vibrio sp. B4-6]OEE79975.1 hypothetical protein A1QQ_01840 [Vibrio ordalii FF-167]OXX21551.1 hypothetical protei
MLTSANRSPDMEFITNPWVITIVILAVFIGNIAALKYTANMKFGLKGKKSDLDKLNELDKHEDSDSEQK